MTTNLRLSVAVIVLFVSGAFAQSTGTVTGTISDVSSAVIPGVSIIATNTQTSLRYETTSTETGNYTLALLPAGMYELTAELPGFRKYVRQGITVLVAQTLRIDVTLEVGASTEQINVTADAPLLRTESSDLTHSVQVNTMTALPILGIGAAQAGSTGLRNPNAAANLIPGAYYSGGNQIRINGAPSNTQSILVEGMDASNSNATAITGGSSPSVEAIQEVAIQTSNYAAEYGQAGGGVFNYTMKSGTNKLHGIGYDYFMNEAFNAGTPFRTGHPDGNPRPRSRRNDYGFNIGGPVLIPSVYDGHNKSFFFFNWEEYRDASIVNNQFATVPTLAYRSGDFSAAIPPNARTIGSDPLGRPMVEGMIYDPATTRTVNGLLVRDPFPGNKIDPSRFDPVAAKILAYYPRPQGPNADALVDNYLPIFKTARVTTVPSIKIDHAIGTNGKLSVFWNRVRTTAAPPGPPNGGNSGLPDPIVTATGTIIRTHITRVNYSHSLTPRLLLHVGVGLHNIQQNLPTMTTTGEIPSFDAEKEIGLHGGVTNKFFPPMSGFLAANGTGGSVNIGGQNDVNNMTQRPAANANITWVKNNHTYKFGSEVQLHNYPVRNFSGTAGNYVFSAAQTGQPFQNSAVQGVNVGFGFASFLLGQVNSVAIGQPSFPNWGKKQIGIYAQDTWKVTRKFTLDYGLRYDYMTYLQDGYGRTPSFSATAIHPVARIPGAIIYEGEGPNRCGCSYAKNYPYGFAPRVGAAYQINSKTVLRLGMGIVYAPTGHGAAGQTGSAVRTFTASTFGLPVTTLSEGIPVSFRPPEWPSYDLAFFPTAFPTPGAGPALIDPNAGRPPRQYQWSIGFQREILQNLAIDAAYVGNRGIWWEANGLLNINAVTSERLRSFGLDLNDAADRTLLTSTLNSATARARGFDTPPYPGFPLGQTVAQALRPYPQFTTIPVLWAPLGKTWYDSLQVRAIKRFSQGLAFNSTFTWSKSLFLGAESDAGGLAESNNVFDRNTNKYLSVHDRPFIWTIAASYTTPRLGTSRLLSSALRDWNYGVFLTYSSGFPLRAPTAQNNPPLQNLIFQPTFANRVPGQPLFLKDLNCHCFDPQKEFVLNPAAWEDPPAGQFGTSAAYYGDYRQQRRPRESMSLGRTFRFTESAGLEIRVEFTNIFNRSVVGNPDSDNYKATRTYVPNGNTAGGFGRINAQSSPTGTATATLVNLSPRTGTLIARFTF